MNKLDGWEYLLIKSERLLLTPFSPADADEVFCCITPTLTRFMGWEPPATKNEFAQVWRSWLPAIKNGSDLPFVIRLISNQKFVGMVGLHHVKTPTPELGIWIREDLHNSGYGRESVAAIISWASSYLKPVCFIYPVAEQNMASRHIVESLGGVESGREIKTKYTSVSYRIPII